VVLLHRLQGRWSTERVFHCLAWTITSQFSPKVESWLLQLEQTMKETVRLAIAEAIAAYEEKPRELWIFDFPAQVALTGSQIWWTTDVGIAFSRLEEGYETALKDFHKKQVFSGISDLTVKGDWTGSFIYLWLSLSFWRQMGTWFPNVKKVGGCFQFSRFKVRQCRLKTLPVSSDTGWSVDIYVSITPIKWGQLKNIKIIFSQFLAMVGWSWSCYLSTHRWFSTWFSLPAISWIFKYLFLKIVNSVNMCLYQFYYF